MRLQNQFQTLMYHLGVDNHHAQHCLSSLLDHYQQPQRYYHDLSHIDALLSYFNQIHTQLHDANAVLLAIFYHDIIYDATRLDNEVKSAALLAHDFDGMIDKKTLDKAQQLILMTAHHQLDDKLDNQAQQDARYFLDMDLAILGSEPTVYQNYAHAIRQEYAQVSADAYQKGRAKVLSNFLQRPRLFFSNEFFDQYERVARNNLIAEIKGLRAGL